MMVSDQMDIAARMNTMVLANMPIECHRVIRSTPICRYLPNAGMKAASPGQGWQDLDQPPG
jgi:hypothetical protein